ncbi:ABC transporter ATP-binding protein [Candidatus Galacturonibacter soehngenii]|uniref:ABC transporter ATP-binding protein n=1 Tax=Candidatus Galacturonatibacter soehngenii TaxID=2307010 RepID=A0A7V7QHX3_9FIRM|nr:ABC transporter ATP-binding protein [Candidatus Galacturonibacter soehngenii]KAB1435716.1 ABC transporter ATP-binding protein [Candidatus Galacturonibacter soehngenii]
MASLLEIKDLAVAYKTGHGTSHAVNGINLTINNGEALGLVGETGAGKTTIALSTLNLLPKKVGHIENGDILFKGKSVFQMNKKELADMRGNKISMIFQNPLTSLNPVFTIGEQISMVLRKHKNLSKKEARMESEELLKMVGIAKSRYDDYPNQFSGGMRQRVGIAAALACNPELLIADEPTTALDVTIQAQILELMKKLQHENSTSLLMITHNLGIISEICEKVAVMYAGCIVEYGTVKEVFSNPKHWYTKGLLGAIPKLEGERERLTAIHGNVANAQDLPSGCKFHPRCDQCIDTCKSEVPSLIQISDDHYAACWNMEVNANGRK